MAQYRYAGPGPVPGPEGEIVHPNDIREYAEEPGWGPWQLVDEGGTGLLRWSGEVSVAVLTPDELAALKRTADAELAAQPPAAPSLQFPVTPKGM